MTDWFQQIMTSTDFVEIDAALFGAIELFHATYKPQDYAQHNLAPYVFAALEDARSTSDLSTKKAWLITFLCTFDDIANYAVQNSNPEKMQKTLDWLIGEHLNETFNGKYAGEQKHVDAFLADVLERYVSF